MMELKNRIEAILKEKEIKPKIVVDLGCKNMPYSELFKDSKIIGFDKIQTIQLHKKIKTNSNISFFFKNFDINQEIPKGDLVIASLFLHFIKEESRKKLFEEIAKSDYFLVAHLDKKISIPSNFNLMSEDEFETEKEKHDGLPEHSHRIFIELYSSSNN